MNIRLWQKLSIVSIILILVLGAVSYLIVSRTNKDITRTSLELAGAAELNNIATTYQNLSKHKAVTGMLARGENGFQETQSNLANEIDRDFNRLSNLKGSKIDQTNNISTQLDSLNSKWLEVKENIVVLTNSRSNEIHNELLAGLEEIFNKVNANSQLLLESELDGYYLVESSNSIMEAIKNDASINSLALGVTKNIEIQGNERFELEKLIGLTQFSINRSLENARQAANINPALQTEVSNLSNIFESYNQHLGMINKQFVNANVIDNIVDFSPMQYYERYSEASNMMLSSFKENTSALSSLLQERLDNLQRLRIIIGALVLALAALVVIATFYISNGIVRQVNSMREVHDRIGKHQFDARADVITNDELGETAKSLNSVLDNLTALTYSTKEESDKTEASIIKLLDEVSGVASGDLTREAEVTADITGAIADSFNYMIGELRKIVGYVQNTSDNVSRSSNEFQQTLGKLSEGSEYQAEQIIDISAAVDELTDSISKVSETAGRSAQVSEEAMNTAKKGTDAVRQTMEGMYNIRQQVQETSKRIKRLGESSQEIGEITQLIGEIADRTSILAINASIQAASAGEAGKGFQVVAQEIEQLATKATESTKRIDTIVKTIQSETNDAVSAMEDTIQEVVEGSKVAENAGSALQEIENVSDQLSTLIKTISTSTEQQSTGSITIAKAMNEISRITQDSAVSTRQAADSVTNLNQLSEQLRESVRVFKLPETNGQMPGEQINVSADSGNATKDSQSQA